MIRHHSLLGKFMSFVTGSFKMDPFSEDNIKIWLKEVSETQSIPLPEARTCAKILVIYYRPEEYLLPDCYLNFKKRMILSLDSSPNFGII